MDTDPLSISFDAPPPPILTPPPEDLTFPAVPPGTLFYLTISNPQADTWTFRGPFPSFAALLPSVEDVLSASSSSLSPPSSGKSKSKRTAKAKGKEPKPEWHTGFTRLVAPSALLPESFSVLDLVREAPPQEIYEAVKEGKQAYTILRAGPLAHDVDPVFGTVRSARGGGRASTSSLVGTFIDKKAALKAARGAMAALLVSAGEEGVEAKEAFGEGGEGVGVIMAISPRARYEVRIVFEGDGVIGALGRGGVARFV